MWLYLNSSQFRFEEVLDPIPFFDHLAVILEPSDTLVLGCYEARPDVGNFLASEARPKFGCPYNYELQSDIDGNRGSYPHGDVFHLPANQDLITQLADFARSVSNPCNLCDHVASYSPEKPIFIFHDAFRGGPLLVSSRRPRERVERFSAAIGTPFSFVEVDLNKLDEPPNAGL